MAVDQFCGIPIPTDDPDLATKLRRVACITATYMVYVTARTLYSFIGLPITTIFSFVVGLAFALLVPACGYFGAKNRSKGLLGCFTCCSCLNMFKNVLYILGFGLIFSFLHLTLPCHSDDPHDTAGCHDLIWYGENALEESQACCKTFADCKFDAESCTSCALPLVNVTMYVEGDAHCPKEGQPSNFTGVFCVDDQMCTGIEGFKKGEIEDFVGAAFAIGMVIFVFGFLISCCVCVSGCQLYRHPHFSAPAGAYAYAAAPTGASVQYPQPTTAAAAYPGGSGTYK